LEAGCVPWVQPWGTAAAKAPLAMPQNAATGRHYSGINVLILWGSVEYFLLRMTIRHAQTGGWLFLKGNGKYGGGSQN
jgi:antirestriction protein ArdC